MSRIYLNNDWQFSFDNNSEKFEQVRIPHTVKETSFHYFSEEEYQTVSLYKRTLRAEKDWQGKKIILTFDGVAHYAEVFINGIKCGEHYSGYTAFGFDISNMLNYGEDNLISVRVDSRESLNIPPFGHVIDYMTYGGIYRDVYIDVKNPTYISDIFAKPQISGRLVSEISLCGRVKEGMTLRQYAEFEGNEMFLGEIRASEKNLMETPIWWEKISNV